jgi:hypothetical protein
VEHRSSALTANDTAAPVGPVHSVAAGGEMAIVGGVVSTTVTVKPPAEVLPLPSVASQVTGVAPIGNTAPEFGVQRTPETEQLSMAVGGVYETVVPPGLVHSALRLLGTANVGCMSSSTVTVALQLVVSWPSSTVRPTDVVPKA